MDRAKRVVADLDARLAKLAAEADFTPYGEGCEAGRVDIPIPVRAPQALPQRTPKPWPIGPRAGASLRWRGVLATMPAASGGWITRGPTLARTSCGLARATRGRP